MSYTALYRKLRPDVFAGVVGQDHIVRTLKNQIESERITHAYLFCGTRGTGKTSTAKIFAKAVNCYSLIDGEPCGVCQSCKEIADQVSMNVIEIDAASNNSVENIRDIREEVKYPPVNAKYKIYIIDEVHMLSMSAFNALLKTLEEPPAHVIFILATTDPQKIPSTIHSRCQRFDFRRISVKDISERLREYMNNENVDINDNALTYIARISDGAMRDAISILDQCISFYYGEKITLEKALDITGSVDNTVFFELTEALIANDSISCINIIDNVIMKGRDVSQFVTEFIVHLRDLLILTTAPKAESALNLSEENIKRFSESSNSSNANKIMELITAFSTLQSKLKFAYNDRILLEVCCIQLCMEKEIEEIEKEESEQKVKKTVKAPKKLSEQAVKTKKKAVPEDFVNVLSKWEEFTAGFAGNENSFSLLRTTKAGYLETNYLYIVCDSITAVTVLKKKEAVIQKKLEEHFGKIFELVFVFKDIYSDMHKKQFGTPDDFNYSDMHGIDEIKNVIKMDITLQ